ncbi:MAG: hypothetical protein R3F59_36710, partial [Myxococcota bacterium]
LYSLLPSQPAAVALALDPEPEPPARPEREPEPVVAVAVEAPEVEPAPVRVRPAPARVPVAVAPAVEHPCDEEGWFYAGRRPRGATFVVPYSVNVRAEPPRAENRWRSDTAVRCYLRKGDVVTLDEPAVDAGRGHYWLHVTPTNTVRPLGDTRTARRDRRKGAPEPAQAGALLVPPR